MKCEDQERWSESSDRGCDPGPTQPVFLQSGDVRGEGMTFTEGLGRVSFSWEACCGEDAPVREATSPDHVSITIKSGGLGIRRSPSPGSW